MEEKFPSGQNTCTYKYSPRHKDVEKADRIQNESRVRKVNFDANNQVPRFYSGISISNDLVNSRPYFSCL